MTETPTNRGGRPPGPNKPVTPEQDALADAAVAAHAKYVRVVAEARGELREAYGEARAGGVTQGLMAERAGVSPQAVAKWGG